MDVNGISSWFNGKYHLLGDCTPYNYLILTYGVQDPEN